MVPFLLVVFEIRGVVCVAKSQNSHYHDLETSDLVNTPRGPLGLLPNLFFNPLHRTHAGQLDGGRELQARMWIPTSYRIPIYHAIKPAPLYPSLRRTNEVSMIEQCLWIYQISTSLAKNTPEHGAPSIGHTIHPPESLAEGPHKILVTYPWKPPTATQTREAPWVSYILSSRSTYIHFHVSDFRISRLSRCLKESTGLDATQDTIRWSSYDQIPTIVLIDRTPTTLPLPVHSQLPTRGVHVTHGSLVNETGA
ncbi:hypothetical protein BO94DRAFT_578079 [Aspergillus sclerotioniger CBS 115572]|uniref:Uncharacterized protein n=1 Tax=Aspergillus sclerotioniger CBS 115572 TaxID=1450535 RepID=A0A317VN65_9EURO|nr:hypothetical protein BO94DRAFT_578079 [Aspergillus sclerotioniger CBS 115572]PWY74527.1 hypothetical protein BO94DRAFT_578079 [Aspergillus sclerotioniger CBS 115572]